MTSAPRLRRGMMVLIGAFGFALALSYAWVLPRMVLDAEDRIFGQQFARLRAQWAEQGEGAGALHAPGVRAIADLSAEDPALASFLAGLPPGVHEFNDDPLPGLEGTELLVAVEAASEDHPKRWLLYDVTGMEALEGPWRPEYLLAVGGGFFLALVATAVGLLAGRRVFVALDDLERLLAAGPPPPGVLSAAERREDEVGRIARLWREADGRLRAALEREQRFTRDASHELRTPIAAARGALELLRAEPEASPVRLAELLRRIDAALLEMADLVGAFLWLAREPSAERAGLDREEFCLGALVERLLAERRTTQRPDTQIHFERRADGSVEGNERLATVVIGNLWSNALLHGSGEVWVEVDGTRISIRNTTRQRVARGDTQGFGFGHAISADLCARFGWHMETWEQDGDFRAAVEFAPERSEAPVRGSGQSSAAPPG